MSAMRIEYDAPLAPMTTFNMGGNAKRLWYPECVEDLYELPKTSDGRYFVLSGGSNLIIDDQGMQDVVCMKEFDKSIVDFGDGVYKVGASATIQKLINTANADGFGGFEELISIPGLIGGLICMNASVPSANACISDYLQQVEAFCDGEVKRLEKDDCDFGYRTSCFRDEKTIVLSATFKFVKQSTEVSKQRIQQRRDAVKRKQDPSAPNFGSVFKKYDPKIMGKVKAKGLNCGDIAFSKKTRNWMLNEGGTSDDAVKLLKRVERMHKLAFKKCEREVVVWQS